MLEKKKIKFSIITVTYNAEKEIIDTLNSVKEQNYENYELIIKDGLSQDETLHRINSSIQNKKNVQIISEKDFGIYHAMNIATNYAIGEYVFFLNAGDRLADENVLTRINEEIIKENYPDIIYGNIIEKGSKGSHIRLNSKNNSRLWKFLIGYCICHQSMFVKKTLLEEKKFDLSYKVCADKEWELYQLKHKKKFLYINVTVAEVLEEGYSSNNVSTLEEETVSAIKKYYGLNSRIPYFIYQIKKNQSIKKALVVVDRLFNVRN